MSVIKLNGTDLNVKDYYCAAAGDGLQITEKIPYLKKPEPALWLYVNLTDICNACCRFCVSRASKDNTNIIDPRKFRDVLELVKPYIYGISFTGGEPMLYPGLLDELISVAADIVPYDMEIDIATNGTDLNKFALIKNINRLTTLHISRHSWNDAINTWLMGRKGPGVDEIRTFIENLNDPGKVVLNCVLQKGGVTDTEGVASYLDMAIRMHVQNSSFISMFMANDYCRGNYVSASAFPIISDMGCEQWNSEHPDSQFSVWNRHTDYEYCHCLSGSYRNKEGRTRFYFRLPGTENGPDFCRQLVYTADNKLQDGFGSDRKILWEG